MAILSDTVVNGTLSATDGIYVNGLRVATETDLNNEKQKFKNFVDGSIDSVSAADLSGITQIRDGAFYGCTSLPSVNLPNDLIGIGTRAFQNCSSFTSITIPSSVQRIGSYAFSGCVGLSSITIPFVGAVAGKTSSDTYQYPFGYIFGTASYTGGKSVSQTYHGSSTSSTTTSVYYIPNSLRSVVVTGGNILRGAFEDCVMLTNITLPSGLTRIEEYAFRGCTSLSNIIIPSTVTYIGVNSFESCEGLTSITIPSLITSIEDSTFRTCYGLVTVSLPSGLTNIGNSAFRECTSLASITIPNSVTGIKQYAFYGCTSLTSITIPNSVTTIGSSIIRSCTGLLSIDIGTGVTSIGTYAFNGCTSLNSFTIRATTPPTLSNTNAFTNTNNCPIYVPSGSVSAYKSATNWSSFSSRIQAIP